MTVLYTNFIYTFRNNINGYKMISIFLYIEFSNIFQQFYRDTVTEVVMMTLHQLKTDIRERSPIRFITTKPGFPKLFRGGAPSGS